MLDSSTIQQGFDAFPRNKCLIYSNLCTSRQFRLAVTLQSIMKLDKAKKHKLMIMFLNEQMNHHKTKTTQNQMTKRRNRQRNYNNNALKKSK